MEKFSTPEQSQEAIDREKVEQYFRASLEREDLIEIPQDQRCEIAVVVPVYSETKESIIAQAESFVGQEGIKTEEFEALYVVNNGEDNGSKEYRKAYRRNQEVLNLPIWKNRDNSRFLGNFTPEQQELFRKIRDRFNFFVIDKSSEGKRVKDSNVGKARNRGVAEACQRFFGNNEKNGILVQTDADARFDDAGYLNKVRQAFNSDHTLIAAAGGFVYEFSPNTRDPGKIERKKREWSELKLMKLVKRMFQDKFYREHPELKKEEFKMSGVNMLSRSFESALVSGVPGKEAGEDTEFAARLAQKAGERGKRVAEMTDKLKIAAGLRESGRTPVEYKRFSGEKVNGEKLVPDPMTPRLYDFKKWKEFDGMSEAEKEKIYKERYPEIPLVTVKEAYENLRVYFNQAEEGKKHLKELDSLAEKGFRNPK